MSDEEAKPSHAMVMERINHECRDNSPLLRKILKENKFYEEWLARKEYNLHGTPPTQDELIDAAADYLQQKYIKPKPKKKKKKSKLPPPPEEPLTP